MYNRYIPEDTSYTWVGEEAQPAWIPGAAHHRNSSQRPSQTGKRAGTSQRNQSFSQGHRPTGGKSSKNTWLGGLESLTGLLQGEKAGGMGGILKRWSGENWDTGDILLLLIVLYLLVEGEDLDLVIALGIVLVMGLGSDKKEEE